MRKRPTSNTKRRDIFIRSMIYGTLAALIFAAAVSGGQKPAAPCLRDIGFIEGRPASLTGFGLVVGLDSTGDGSRLAHTDKTLLATLSHLGIDPVHATVATEKIAAVFVQAEFRPGMDVGSLTDVRVTALNDATDLTGGRLLPVTLHSRDGRFYGQIAVETEVDAFAFNPLAPAGGMIRNALICSSSVFMTDVPDLDFVIELRGVDAGQVAQVAERINQTFGQIAFTHSGCDIEIKLPAAYEDFAERASLVLQIAALPIDGIIPTLLVDRDALPISVE